MFNKRKPKALIVCTGAEDMAEEGNGSMWSPSTGIDDLFSGGAHGSSAYGAKGKTPTSFNVLLDGQQGFVDAGTPNLKLSDVFHSLRSPHGAAAEMPLESEHCISAADVASMMNITPPKSSLIKVLKV